MSHSTLLGPEHTVTLPSCAVRFRETGTGPPVVFVHGLLVNGDLWRNVVPTVASAGYRCITPDWPLGSHELAAPAADMSLPGLAGLVDELLTTLDLEDVTLVANDTGGAIVQSLLARRPRRVRAVVLTPCDAFDNFLPRPLWHLHLAGRYPAGLWIVGQSLRFRALQRLPVAFGLATLRAVDPQAMDSYGRPLRSSAAVRRDFSRLVRAIRSRYTQAAAKTLAGSGVEALVVWSAHDRLFPLEHGRQLAQLLSAPEPVIIADSAAFIPEDQPAALAEQVVAFLQRSKTPSPTSA